MWATPRTQVKYSESKCFEVLPPLIVLASLFIKTVTSRSMRTVARNRAQKEDLGVRRRCRCVEENVASAETSGKLPEAHSTFNVADLHWKALYTGK